MGRARAKYPRYRNSRQPARHPEPCAKRVVREKKERPMPVQCDEIRGCCPCLVLAHSGGAFVEAAGQALRRGGWDVYPARSGPEARRLARMIGPDLVVLDAHLPCESGWL